MKTVARLAVRKADGDDADKGSANLLLGVCFKGNTFKPNHVYEIQEIMGEFVLKDMGPSINANATGPDDVWNHTVNEVLETYKHRVILTIPEWNDACEKGKGQG